MCEASEPHGFPASDLRVFVRIFVLLLRALEVLQIHTRGDLALALERWACPRFWHVGV